MTPQPSIAGASRGASAGTSTSTVTTSSSSSGSFAQGSRIHLPQSPRLVLRAEQVETPEDNIETQPRRRIHWAEDVVNNEGMGKKSSKVCCIYHKPRAVGESSDESSSDSSSDDDDSDSEADDGSAKLPRRHGRHQHGRHQHSHHNHGNDHGRDHKHEDRELKDNSGNVNYNAMPNSKQTTKNAYESIPKH